MVSQAVLMPTGRRSPPLVAVQAFVLYFPEAWRSQPQEWVVFEEVAASVIPALQPEDATQG